MEASQAAYEPIIMATVYCSVRASWSVGMLSRLLKRDMSSGSAAGMFCLHIDLHPCTHVHTHCVKAVIALHFAPICVGWDS